MRVIARSLLLAILIAGLLNLPAFAANEKPHGMIVQADQAHLAGINAATGATVYPGDALDTEAGGTLRLKLGGGQLYLGGASGATLSQRPGAYHVVVNRGTVGFASSASETIELETKLGIVRPAAGAAFGQVTITGPEEMIVSAYRGDLVVDYNGESQTIPEGKSYRVSFDLEPPAQPNAAQTPTGSGTTKSAVDPHIVAKLVGTAVLGVGIFFAWRELCESPFNF